MLRPLFVVLFGLLLTHALLGCGGCSGREKTKAPVSSPEKIVWKLTPEAQNTYLYLVLNLAMRRDDDAQALEALNQLAALPESDPRVFLEGAVWMLAKKSPHAQEVIEKALAAHPDDVSLHLLHAEALLEFGQAEKALARMRAFAETHPGETDAKIELALLLVKLKQPAEAERILAALPAEDRTAMVEYYHARALNDLNRPDEAIAHFQAAVKRAPKFLEAWAELAHMYERRKELKKAHAAYEELLRLSENSPEVLLRLTAISLRLGEKKHALEFVRKGPDTPSFILTAANMFIEARQWDTAEALLMELRAKPAPPEELYFFLAGIAVEARNSPEEALRWIDRITPNSRAYERAVPLKVQLLANMDKQPEALAFLRQERAAQPDNKEYIQLEIRLLAAAKKWDEALKAADSALKAHPDDLDLAFLRASILDEYGKKQEAYAAMEAIVKTQPDHFQALNYMGYTLADENRDLPKALELLTKAVSLAPDRAYIVDSLAWAQYRLGKFDAAWESIRRAVELENSDDPTIWEHYGDIAKALGNTQEARKGYVRALEFKPENADSLRERLSKL